MICLRKKFHINFFLKITHRKKEKLVSYEQELIEERFVQCRGGVLSCIPELFKSIN